MTEKRGQEPFPRRKRFLTPFLLVAALIAVSVPPALRFRRAAMVLRGLEATAPSGDSIPVHPFHAPDRPGRPLGGRVYEGGGAATIVLCPGAAPTGIDDPRLVALARALARAGARVVTPDLEDLRALRITGDTVDRIEAAVRSLPWPVTLMGISFAGSHCLRAAARPSARERVRAVLSLGGYAELEPLVRGWLTAPAPADGSWPEECYGKWVYLENHLERFAAPSDRPALREAIRSLLDGKGAPPPAGLTPEGRRLFDQVARREPLPLDEVEALIAPTRAELRALSPSGQLDGLAAPVFLLHATGDALIPESESRRLAGELAGRVPVRLLVTDLLNHVTVGGRPDRRQGRALAAFLASLFRSSGW